MSIRKPTFNVRNLNKPSAVLRKAAEHIQYEMTQCPVGQYEGRDGVCSAFYEVEDRLQDSIYERDSDSINLTYAARNKAAAVEKTVNAARELFKQHFGYTGHKRARQRKGYWFGKHFTDANQQVRIEALLLAAEIAETQGQ